MKDKLAAIFEEWMKQYNANPTTFDTRNHRDDTTTYGEQAATTLLAIADELKITL